MRSASKITLIYFIVSFLWILFSDQFITTLSDDPIVLTKLQTYKGWFFVVSTSVFLYALISREITRKNQLLEELKSAKEKAEQSEKLKSSFLSNMSHEIRTPLNGIVGFSQLLFDNDDDEKKRQLYIDQVNRNSDMLLRIINNILEISKIQEKMIEPVIEEISASDTLRDIELNYGTKNSLLKQKGLEFKLEVSEECQNRKIHTDTGCLKQILFNFIDNAIKYTPHGTITLGCRFEESFIRISVEDTGIGISEENLSHIFERFRRMTNGNEVSDGFGLGLSISKGLAEVIGAKIEVSSEQGAGSRFSILLPLKTT